MQDKIIIVMALLLVGFELFSSISTAIPNSRYTQNKQSNTQKTQSNTHNLDRPLLLTITVNDPNSLRVKTGDFVKVGDVIADNLKEKSRLSAQRKNISLEIAKLKDSKIIPPRPLRKFPPIRHLPPANYTEELGAISSAKLKLQHANLILAHRTPQLTKVDDLAYQQAQSKVDEQSQIIQEMQNIKAQSEVMDHESAVMKKLQGDLAKAKDEMEQAKSNQAQELEQLRINVQLAESELQRKEEALLVARSRRKMQEFTEGAEDTKRSQQEEQLALEHARQFLVYEQQRRDLNYKVAQLGIRQQQIDDKLADLSTIRSPKSGYIKHIAPWIGRNGKYTTRLIIAGSYTADSSSDSSSSTESYGEGDSSQSSDNPSSSPNSSSSNSDSSDETDNTTDNN